MQTKYRVFSNTLPKAGTHLLAKVLDELGFLRKFDIGGNEGPPSTTESDETILVSIDRPELHPYAEVYNRFATLRENEYASGHLPYSEVAVKMLNELQFKKFIMIRDPRDVVVSHFHYFNRVTVIYKDYLKLADKDAQLMASIKGFSPEQSGHKDVFLLDIGQRLDNVIPWLYQPDCLLVRFEDLVGERGGGTRARQLQTLKNICNHLSLDLSYQELIYLASRIFDTSTHTFRKGQIGDWRNHFKAEHVAAFQACASKQLLELNYESNDAWAKTYLISQAIPKTEEEPPSKPPLFKQEAEANLLRELLQCLDNKIVIDIGAEKGGFSAALLEEAGAEVYAFEPFPAHANYLKREFASNPAFHLFEIAVGEKDASGVLHIAEKLADGEEGTFHSLLDYQDTSEVHWVDALPVECRSLNSLMTSKIIPSQAAILRIATRGSEYDIVQGMRDFYSDVIMLDYWIGFPDRLPYCPWHILDMVELMASRGYSNFIFLKHHDEFLTVELNNAQVQIGDWGNLIFLHDSVFGRLAPALYRATRISQAELVSKAKSFRTEAQNRLGVIEGLETECQKRLEIIHKLEDDYQRQLEFTQRLEAECQERLELIQRLDAECQKRLELIEQLDRQLRQSSGNQVLVGEN